MVAPVLIDLKSQQSKLGDHTVISICVTTMNDEILFTNKNIPSNLSQIETDQWQFPQNARAISFLYELDNDNISRRTSNIHIVDDLEQNKDLVVRKKDGAVKKSDAIFCRSTCKLYQMSRNKDWTNSISSPKNKKITKLKQHTYFEQILG
jgi:hypothetical protein